MEIKGTLIITKENVLKTAKKKSIICWSDLLEGLQLLPVFKRYKEKTGEQYDIKFVFMGKTLINQVNEILKKNCLKSKDLRVCIYKDQYKLSAFEMDALWSCPTTAKDDIDYLLLTKVV